MEKNKIFKKNSDYVIRTIGGETILVPICKVLNDIQSIYTLNTVATRILELIDGKRTLEKIVNIIVDEFDVEYEKANKAIIEFIEDLKSIQAILS